MSEIHYFQRFSNKENVATNNTLLLLRRLYQYESSKFEGFLDYLIGGQRISIGPRFTQQVGGKEHTSVPDGSIRQQSFRILVETKMHVDITVDQIRRHLMHFGNEDMQIMLTISPSPLEDKRVREFQVLIDSHNQTTGGRVVLASATFGEIVEAVYAAINSDRDFEMVEIVGDYENYCRSSDLLPRVIDKLRAIVAGKSFDECLQYNVYYTLAERSFNPHSYIGLYKDKSIRAVGKIEKIVEADLEPGTGRLVIEGSPIVVSDDQERRIREVIRIATARGWGVNKGHRFFLVEKFESTDFRKISPGGLWGTKYFHLKDYLNLNSGGHRDLPSIEIIASELRVNSWT